MEAALDEARVRACVGAREVGVRVEGRCVVLEGALDDAELAEVCDALARGVPGVVAVRQDLFDDVDLDGDLDGGDWTAGYEHAGRAR